MKYFAVAALLLTLAGCGANGTAINGEGGSSGTYNHVKVGVPF